MYRVEVICGVTTGALVTLDGNPLVHRGTHRPWNGNFGEVVTDCGLSGLGYVTGDQVPQEERCQQCPPVQSIPLGGDPDAES